MTLLALALVGALTPSEPASAESTSIEQLAAADGTKVELRNLIIATDPDDFGLDVWKQTLDRVGTPYDVIFARSQELRAHHLIRPDGTGRYNAVLLTNHALLFQDTDGEYRSAFDDVEWSTLWAYERAFEVRQAALYAAYGTFPEESCLRPGSEGPINETPEHARLTPAGAEVFDRLDAGALVPISYSYVYRSTLVPGCAAEPLLTLGEDVVGFRGTTPDGRERAGLTFSSGVGLMHADLLGYGLLRWANRGVLLGEQRHWINVDVDDWFNTTDHLLPDGTVDDDPGFRLTGPEVPGISQQQAALRQQHHVAAGFKLNLAYNGGDLDPFAPAQCSSQNTPDPLTSYSRCLRNEFRWINHTVNHPEMNLTGYAENYLEITDNLARAQRAGLTVPPSVLKTPEYSGLGVYNPDPNAPDDEPVTDFGLEGSNKELLKAAKDLGVKYLHGNMSFESHQPDCFNCGIYHPLQPEVFVVPDWPTNIGYQTTTPAEQVLLYNSLYGPDGRFPFFDHDLTYAEMLAYESDQAVRQLMSGTAYTYTLHQGNLHVYAPGRSLTFDWLGALVEKYDSFYNVPLQNPDWPALGAYVETRNSHFAHAAHAGGAVWDRATGTVSYTPATSGSLFVTGVLVPGQTQRYGTDNVTRVQLTAGQPVTLPATPHA